ncbi:MULTISPECIES: sugar ABC transporter substrate-binding protein [Paenibacillus]|uniref:Periplasmic binding protein n=1 Tax=Paenibacillus naphthalenovorans TaxID=162209 RepID=A0A0U2W0X3_9BACL|nr:MULTISPECIES: sugar ABC transporter substrate-binding protein [Paenibacillus]ALS25383.1 periplasmic binding protein [Paenibacillus naphthalenovorans]SDJ93683.1 ribose transport system substrate-binding protein [Paenibacillus naphthalenovorans]
MKSKKILVIFSLILMILLSSACSVDNSAAGTETSTPSGQNDQENTAKDAQTTSFKDSGLKGVVDGLPVPSLEGKKIGIAVVGTDHNFDRQAYQGQIDRVKELGGTPIAVDGERNDQKAIADIENLIIQKPDAIIKQLGDTKVFAPTLKKVVDAKIPLFTVDHPSEYSITNHLSDNYYIGEVLARTIFENMGGEGKVAVFNGFYGVRVVAIRYDMLKYVARDYPKIEFIEPELQDVIPGTIEDARKKVQDLLVKYPEKSGLKAIWAGWDIPSIGASQAVDAAGRKDIKVYGVDGDPAAIDLLADPNTSFAADVAQEPYKIGQSAVDSAARYLAGLQVPKSVYVEPLLVTKENAEQAKKILFK